jgi:flagellar L-ring protein precursor FlgH
VLPGGNLVIEARRQIQVNGERETLTLRGIVRPEDIGPSNAVLSTAIADLVLEYGGKGVIGANLKPSFLFRILRFIF